MDRARADAVASALDLRLERLAVCPACHAIVRVLAREQLEEARRRYISPLN